MIDLEAARQHKYLEAQQVLKLAACDYARACDYGLLEDVQDALEVLEAAAVEFAFADVSGPWPAQVLVNMRAGVSAWRRAWRAVVDWFST